MQAYSAVGGVAHRSRILDAGVTPARLLAAARRGELDRVRTNWYAVPTAPSGLVRAVRVGGSLTAVSACLDYGLWTLDDGMLHVSVARNAGRLRSPDSIDRPLSTGDGVCVHWRAAPGTDAAVRQPPAAAVVDAIGCQSEENAIAIIDSALNLGLVTKRQLRARCAGESDRYRRALERADGRSQSGTETLVRLRLRRLGMRVRIQEQCSIARVDILVGDRLVIECHSRAHHTGVDNYARDRERELALVEHGFRVMTLSYEQILFDWPRVQAVIRARVARGDHRWPRRRA